MTEAPTFVTPRRRGRPPKSEALTSEKTMPKRAYNSHKTLLPSPAPTAMANLLKDTHKTLKQLDTLISQAEAQVQQLAQLKQQRQECLMLALSLEALGKAKKLTAAQPAPLPLQVSEALAPWVTAAPQPELNPQPVPTRVALATEPKRRGRPPKEGGATSKATTGQKRGRKPPNLAEAPMPEGVFIPDLALEQAKAVIKRPGTLNHDLYKAIVYSGGRATSEQVKNYLLNNDIRSPKNNATFEDVPLAKIASRVYYLVQHGSVSQNNGVFISRFGWQVGITPPANTPHTDIEQPLEVDAVLN